jgi:hypothetical protein
MRIIGEIATPTHRPKRQPSHQIDDTTTALLAFGHEGLTSSRPSEVDKKSVTEREPRSSTNDPAEPWSPGAPS